MVYKVYKRTCPQQPMNEGLSHRIPSINRRKSEINPDNIINLCPTERNNITNIYLVMKQRNSHSQDNYSGIQNRSKSIIE